MIADFVDTLDFFKPQEHIVPNLGEMHAVPHFAASFLQVTLHSHHLTFPHRSI